MAGCINEFPADDGGPRAAIGPLEQLRAKVTLEITQPPAERRLANI
jgi:hypothetical protein